MRNKTLIFIVTTLLAITLWDLYAINGGGKEASISHMLIELSYEYPSVSFLIGFVMGHLFWRMKETKIFTEKLK